MPTKSAAPEAPVSNLVRLKVRHKHGGKISKGERAAYKDEHYAAGEVFDAEPHVAEALLDRDLVEPVEV